MIGKCILDLDLIIIELIRFISSLLSEPTIGIPRLGIPIVLYTHYSYIPSAAIHIYLVLYTHYTNIPSAVYTLYKYT